MQTLYSEWLDRRWAVVVCDAENSLPPGLHIVLARLRVTLAHDRSLPSFIVHFSSLGYKILLSLVSKHMICTKSGKVCAWLASLCSTFLPDEKGSQFIGCRTICPYKRQCILEFPESTRAASRSRRMQHQQLTSTKLRAKKKKKSTNMCPVKNECLEKYETTKARNQDDEIAVREALGKTHLRK